MDFDPSKPLFNVIGAEGVSTALSGEFVVLQVFISGVNGAPEPVNLVLNYNQLPTVLGTLIYGVELANKDRAQGGKVIDQFLARIARMVFADLDATSKALAFATESETGQLH